MTERSIREELLRQNGAAAVDQEIGRLNQLIEAERRRARRLAWLTISAWALWVMMLAASLSLPMIYSRLAQADPERGVPVATRPAVPPAAAPAGRQSGIGDLIGPIIGIFLVALFFALPLIGIILAIMLILARRSLSMNQVRASLASIDAQLRLLAMTQKPNPPAPPSPPA